MKDHNEVRKLVVIALKNYHSAKVNPTSRDIYMEVRAMNPKVVRDGYRSFVKIMNMFPEVEITKGGNGSLCKYSLRH